MASRPLWPRGLSITGGLGRHAEAMRRFVIDSWSFFFHRPTVPIDGNVQGATLLGLRRCLRGLRENSKDSAMFSKVNPSTFMQPISV